MGCNPERGGLLRLTVATVALAALLGGSGDAADTAAEQHRARAVSALAQGDGVAAQVELGRALGSGAARDDVAAAMGEALLAQDDLTAARIWLGPQKFAFGEAGRGFRALGVLERRAGHLPEAGRAFDQALRFIPRDPRLWVEIARLRYAGGEHGQAFNAARHALELGPQDVGALQLNALLIRDAQGGGAALPLLDRALVLAPANLALANDRAATLAELGRATEALAQVRSVLAQDRENGAAGLIQAVIAARADKPAIARRLIYAAGERLPQSAATVLLRGVVELETGNPNTAASILTGLADGKPDNRRVQLMLGRAMLEAGDDGGVVARFGTTAARPDSPRYLVEIVARALENRGDRVGAAALRDDRRAGLDARRVLAPGGRMPMADIRRLAAAGDIAGAQRAADEWLTGRPGLAEAWQAAGDTALLAGDYRAAAGRYRGVLRIRQSAGAVAGLRIACRQGGGCDAVAVARSQLARFPSDLATLADLARTTHDNALVSSYASRAGTLDK